MQNVYDSIIATLTEEFKVREQGLSIYESSSRLVKALHEANLIIKIQLNKMAGLEDINVEAHQKLMEKRKLANSWQGNVVIAQMYEAEIKSNLTKMEVLADEIRRGNSKREATSQEAKSILDRLISECKFKKALEIFKQDYFGDAPVMVSADSYSAQVQRVYRGQKTDCPAEAIAFSLMENPK